MKFNFLRILDANANRAREALRVIEDYARFSLNDRDLCAELKFLRHDLNGPLDGLANMGLICRDAAGDVGTSVSTPTEQRRLGIADVVIAAGKRLGEALRSIEEYLKILEPEAAARVEAFRYRFYDLELRIVRTLRPAELFGDIRLYVLVTESACKRPWLEVARAAIDNGADCIQLREKELGGAELLKRARTLAELCHDAEKLFIVNDRPDIAVLSCADGVHLGQDDLPAVEARKIVGPDCVVGVSTHRLQDARQAVLDGADYVGVGPVYRSATKTRDFTAGLGYAREVAEQVKIPGVAIAGIDESNAAEVLATGIAAIAVTAAVAGADDPGEATRRLREIIDAHRRSVGQTFLSARENPPANQRPPASPTVGQTFLSAQKNPSEDQQPPAAQSQTGIREGHSGQTSRETRRQADGPPPAERIVGRTFWKYGRRLPHWRMEGASYFVTFRCIAGEIEPAERTVIFEHFKEGDPKFYTLYAAVVMPDHAHMVLRPAPGIELSRITKGTKGATGRKINQMRGVVGNFWQDESFDRLLRDQEEFDEKVEYCMNNAVKKELVSDPWDYPWWHYRRERD